jgi:uncharacterized protein YcfJ
MNHTLKIALGASAIALAAQAMAQVTFYESEGFRGRAFTTTQQVDNLERRGFNDRASSAVVERGNWEVCDDARFGGRCTVLRKGSYDSLRGLGLENRISSVRPVNGNRHYTNEAPEPLAAPNYEYRRRANERVYEAKVTSVHAVLGAPGQRCWVERQQVNEPARSDRNVGGAILGGLLGGVLGHQVGGGTGRDIATAGGAVAGAVIGSNAGRDSGGGVTERNVQRCETVSAGPPQYWDVSYVYRGTTHQVQMSSAPGSTIPVNAQGEPRL